MALVWQDTGMKKSITNQNYIDSANFKTVSIIKHQNNVWKLEIDFPLLEKKF